jgi:hypothetical protein
VRGSPLLGGVLAAGTLFVATGCGGTSIYSAEKSRACLEKAGALVTKVPATDFIAENAEGGSFTVRFRDNLVTVSFGVDRKGAEQIVRGYQRFRGENIGLEDVLRPEKNAVLLWALHPPEAYERTIQACLK